MKIAIIGNCQVPGLACCMRKMLPTAVVDPFFLTAMTADDLAAFYSNIESYDHVFTQPINAVGHALHTQHLRGKAVELHLVPTITFAGFHPDVILIPGYQSAAGNYHSAIVVISYLLGLPWTRAARLFNAYIYGSLGYFGSYEISRQFILAAGRKTGYDLTRELTHWETLGVFMHTVNHPRQEVLASLARTLAVGAELVDADAPTPELANDYFATHGVIWPVYPEIAKQLNLTAKGSLLFRTPNRTLELEQFVSESYSVYHSVSKDLLETCVGDFGRVLKQLIIS